jgi:hypothetical protein
MDMLEPGTDDSDDSEESDAEPMKARKTEHLTGFDSNANTYPAEGGNFFTPKFSTSYQLVLHSFIITSVADGLLNFFLPTLTTSFLSPFSVPTLLRSQGICLFSLAALWASIIQVLNGKTIDLRSIFNLCICFHCSASLSNLVFLVLSNRTGIVDIYGWAKLIFLIPWLIGFVETERRGLLDSILSGSGLWKFGLSGADDNEIE